MKRQGMRARMEQHRANVTAAADSGTSMVEKMLELVLQAALLLLSVAGFLFCFITAYDLTVQTARVIWTGLMYVVVVFAVCSIRRSAFPLLAAALAMLLYLSLRAKALLSGLVVLLTQAVTPLNLILPEFIDGLYTLTGGAEDIRLATMALCALLFPVTLLSGLFIIRKPSVTGLMAVTLLLLLPTPFYALAPATLPAFCLVAAFLTLSIVNGGDHIPVTVGGNGERSTLICRDAGRPMQRTARKMLAFLILPLIAIAALFSGWILPERNYERPESIEALQKRLLDVDLADITGRSNDGLTHGNLRDLSAIYYTGKTVLKIRTTAGHPLYLRDFAGVRFDQDGWHGADGPTYARYAAGFADIAPQNLYAAAAAASGSASMPFTLSVQNIAAIKTSLYTPNGLVTKAAQIEGAAYAEDTALTADGGKSVPHYSVEAYTCGTSIAPVSLQGGADSASALLEAYRSAAGSAWGLGGLSGTDAKQTKLAADAYLSYIFAAYTELPPETQAAAETFCREHGISLTDPNGTADVFAVCRALYRYFNEQCTYAYSPPEIPADADFVDYFLTESRAGYCVHFATSAAVLLRSLGIPARYAEGYIIVSSDYTSEADEEGYLSIDDTHAHAWVEVFDPAQLEWIPIEMTPGSGADTASAAQTGATPEPADTPEPTPEPTPTPTETPADTEQPEDSAAPSATPEAGGAENTTPEPTQDAGGLVAATPEPEPGGDTGGGDDPEPDGDPEGGDAEASGASTEMLKKLLRILLPPLLLLLLLFALREALRAYRTRKLLGADTNAAVLYGGKLALGMLRAAGVAPMQPTETPETYTQRLLEAVPDADGESVLALLKAAQRARFSGKTCTKRERREAAENVIRISDALLQNMKRLRRWLFMLRYPKLRSVRK